VSSTSDTKAQIESALTRFGDEVPALKGLALVIALELRARGDAPVWSVEVPGPKITKEPPNHARVEVSVDRPHFNELAKEGTLKQWISAYEKGFVRVNGDPGVVKLIGNVIERQRTRAR
jgi:hypothetical protein